MFKKTNSKQITGWVKLISLTGSAQVVVQAVGMLSGIIIIRLLSVEEYAFYTLANTMLGTMTILADGGISSGVIAEGGKVWQNTKKLGSVINTGLKLRKSFALFSLLILLPVLGYLLWKNDASWQTIGLVSLSILPAFYAALSDKIYQIPLKLNQSIAPLQKNQVLVSIGRLVLISGSLFIFPFTFIALLGNGIPRLIGNYKLKKLSEPFTDFTEPPKQAINERILKIVKLTIPGSIYFCISGQITVWLLSLFGNTNAVAQIGALGRISTLFSLFTILSATLFIPRFARQKQDYSQLLRVYIKILLVIFSVLFFAVLLLKLFSPYVLIILGKDYTNLNYELFLSLVAAGVGVLSGVSFNLNSSRGWIINPIMLIGFNLLGIFISIVLLDLSNLIDVLLMNIIINLIGLVLNVFFGFYKIFKFK